MQAQDEHLGKKATPVPGLVLHKANTRGHANHGWLNSWHSFSFASYHDPERMQFGALRVLNDDTVSGGAGFGRHQHANMEIISIVLEGTLEHADSLGNVHVMQKGDVQVMSAGSGVQHSEKNADALLPVKFLQIWVLPNQQDIPPRYAQQHFDLSGFQDLLVPIVSPIGAPSGLNIYQDAWFSLGKLAAGKTIHYQMQQTGNGVYAFLIEGDVTIENVVLNKRDGLGIYGKEQLQIKANTDALLLLMEVPYSV